MLDYYDGDLVKLRDALTGTVGMGFGNKKTDMFLRDMAVHEVWTDYLNFDRLDVASDINTMKVALRTGILETAIPLVSSFIDIFCHQYVYMDEMNAVAWRPRMGNLVSETSRRMRHLAMHDRLLRLQSHRP